MVSAELEGSLRVSESLTHQSVQACKANSSLLTNKKGVSGEGSYCLNFPQQKSRSLLAGVITRHGYSTLSQESKAWGTMHVYCLLSVEISLSTSSLA